MNPYRISMALTAAVTNGIATSQTLGAAGSLTLNGSLVSGGVATLTSTNCAARRVGITSVGNDSGLTWTITGTSRTGLTHSETLAGANNGTAQSAKDYATVTSIKSSGATASTVTAGTTTVASTAWNTFDVYRETFNVGLGLTVSGTVTATIEYTFDDPNGGQVGSIEPASTMPPLAFQHVAFNGVSVNTSGNIAFPVFAARLTVNSGTGTAIAQMFQSGTCM